PSTSRSLNRMRFQKSASRCGSVWYEPSWCVATVFRSFHSWQAASQALQPMHVVVSMYLETTGFSRKPVLVPHMAAEERLISSACTVMIASSRLFQVYQERFVLRRPGVRIADGRRQEIRQRSCVALLRRVAPVNGESDVPDVLAVDLQRRHPVGDHGRPFDRSARGRHFDLRSV